MTKIAYISDFDYGTGDPTAGLAVQTFVQSLAPDYVVTGGDNRQTAKTYTQLFNDYTYYRSLITADPSTNKFWPCFGNHDQTDYVVSQDWFTYFSFLTGPKYYYTKVLGECEFFFLSTWIESDGVTHPSVQSAWLQAALAASTATWKIVVCHVPPYTDHTGNYTQAWMRNWPFKTWGADLVLSGHTHGHERFRANNLDYLVGGWSGKAAVNLALNNAETKFKVELVYGCILLTATADTLLVQAMQTDGTVIDSLFLGDPPSDCGTVTVQHPEAAETEYWNGGADMPAGTYGISYVGGAYDTDNDGFHIYEVFIFANTTFLYNDTAGISPPYYTGLFYTQASAVAYWNGWASAPFVHTGGKIGMRFVDVGYSDNAPGNPSSTFRLTLIALADQGDGGTTPTPDAEDAEEEVADVCEIIDCCEQDPFAMESDQAVTSS